MTSSFLRAGQGQEGKSAWGWLSGEVGGGKIRVVRWQKEESEKTGLKVNIQKAKIMASSPITSWRIDGEIVETARLFSWAPRSLWMVTTVMRLKEACSLEEKQ